MFLVCLGSAVKAEQRRLVLCVLVLLLSEAEALEVVRVLVLLSSGTEALALDDRFCKELL